MSGRRLQRGISRFFNYLLQPGVCLGCGCELRDNGSLCASCNAKLRQVPNPCQYCAQPNPASGLVCPVCLLNPPRWQKMIAPLQYRGLARDYLIQLKFAQALHLAKTLTLHNLDSFRQTLPKPEVLIPVPLYRDRLLERGYNQALEVAAVCSRALGIPVDRHSLIRLRATESQSGLNARQRRLNMRRAFAYTTTRQYRHVAVVDDIVTTGSTAGEITRELHKAGVEYVEIWALARAYRR